MVKQEGAKDAKNPKQATLASFFGKPKSGPVPSRPLSAAVSSVFAPSPTFSPSSTTLRTPSDAGSSPLTAMPRTTNAYGTSINGKTQTPRGVSPLKRLTLPTETPSGTQLTPLPSLAKPSVASSSRLLASERTLVSEDMEIDDDQPVITGRRTKRKVIYAESESEEDAFAGPSLGARSRLNTSRKADSGDEYELGDDDVAIFAAVADKYEESLVSDDSSFTGNSPALVRKKSRQKPFATPNTVSKKPNTSWARPSSPPSEPAPSSSSRPGPRPLASRGEDIDSPRGAVGSRSAPEFDSWLLTTSERQKLDKKDEIRNKDSAFSFLSDLRDKQKRRPDHPDYDARTLYIPPSAFDAMTPFEVQFWEQKQNNFDTVLFFQKGKFYELYENDAYIGHSEFDLKLTDRVKMKMVGVPEQSWDYWASKFLAAGYKVGKVVQKETAIGKDLRQRKEGKSTGGDKIVQRDLEQIFTNGTIVDATYLTSDEANHCVAIKEGVSSDPSKPSSFGICVLDASTGEFNFSAFDDDICRTRLETMFRQVRPKELLHVKGNLSVYTTRLLRAILPGDCKWESFRDVTEFTPIDETLRKLGNIFETETDARGTKPQLPEAIGQILDQPLAVEALGGMLFYLQTLHLDKDLVSQRNFNIYDPLKEGKSLLLDGQTLGHMEVLLNNEGGQEGTLLELLQRCQTPFGKRLFRIWLISPLRDTEAINARLDAVDDLMKHENFCAEFRQFARDCPDLERMLSRLHAGALKQSDFVKVMRTFDKILHMVDRLQLFADSFESQNVGGLLRSAPDLRKPLAHIDGMFSEIRTDKTLAIEPRPGADSETDEAEARVREVEAALTDLLEQYKSSLKLKEIKYWHSAQGGKEIYQLEVSASAKVPSNWTKQSGTKSVTRYYAPQAIPLIKQIQEAREELGASRRSFYQRLLVEFDLDRSEWLKAVRIVAELDCLISLALVSASLDEPKCRPEFVVADQAFIDFEQLRHPSMCLRADFIPNDVQLGEGRARTVLLTGPNMAGKSTLLRMTAAGVIMAQLGCYVPAASARLAPMDRIQTRMGAYDNMFASASTFKVELDECSKILREAGPKSLVVLDELGRGTSTYDGMAIASAVLHYIATHTLPLAFFATHYGSLTNDFSYHPNIRKMHMQTHVDDKQLQVVFLYKLIPGVAESSHGTHVARMAGVPNKVVARADSVSAQFFKDFQEKLVSRRQSAMPITAQADLVWLMKLATGGPGGSSVGPAKVAEQMCIIRNAMDGYGRS